MLGRNAGTRAVLAASLAAMVSAGANAFHRVLPEGPRLDYEGSDGSATIGSSRNGGRRSSNRAQQRAATKRRNVLRFKRSQRGHR